MAQSTIQSDVFVNGSLSAVSVSLPNNTVLNAGVGTGAAGQGVAASKLQHQHQQVYRQGSAVTAASEAFVAHVVRGSVGTINDLRCGNVVAAIGAATVTLDLKKNGASVLTAVVTLSSTTTAYSVQLSPAGYTSTALVAGDVLELNVVATAGGGTLPKGVFAVLVVREDAQ